jgi:NADP-dependent 3-hydroxy acid dehydrogenase YdfG
MSAASVFVVTGERSGIGAETARRAAAAGYDVVLAARRKSEIAQLADELGGPRHAVAIPTNVTSWEANEALVVGALEAFGRLDVVFANAGMGGSRGWYSDTPEHWRNLVLTNVLGAAYSCARQSQQ